MQGGDKVSFGKRLIELRENRNISRKELAEIMEVPYTTLRNYETDAREPGHLFLIKLSKYFNVTTDFLLDVEEAKSKSVKSSVADELFTAYDQATFDKKNIVRLTLGLPLLKEQDMELNSDLKTS